MGQHNLQGIYWCGPNGDDERALAEKYRGWSKVVAYQYPFLAKVREDIAKTYDHEAMWHDADAGISAIKQRLAQRIVRTEKTGKANVGEHSVWQACGTQR